MTGLTESIARFIAGAGEHNLPDVAIESSKRVLADTFAVILAGAGTGKSGPREHDAR